VQSLPLMSHFLQVRIDILKKVVLVVFLLCQLFKPISVTIRALQLLLTVSQLLLELFDIVEQVVFLPLEVFFVL
jgi:hypothetical protein